MKVIADSDPHRGLLPSILADRRAGFQTYVFEFAVTQILI